MMKDTFSEHKAMAAISPAVFSANSTGSTIALAGFDSALFVVNTGEVTGDGKFSVKLQESDTKTDGDFKDVGGADQLGVLPASLSANTAYKLGYIGSKRKKYVRAVVTKASGTSIALSVVAILGHPSFAPVA